MMKNMKNGMFRDDVDINGVFSCIFADYVIIIEIILYNRLLTFISIDLNI